MIFPIPLGALRKFNLEKAVENYLPLSRQERKGLQQKKIHPFGEAIDHLDLKSSSCFSWRLCAFAVEVRIPPTVLAESNQEQKSSFLLS